MTNEPGPALVQVDATHVVVAGRRLVYFGGCDYFRLSRHPAVARALMRGVAAHGVGVAASRMTTGNHPVYGALEREVAEYFEVPAAVLLPCGSLTNLAVAAALAGRFDRVLLDARAHTCLREAAGRFGCPVVEFAHRSVEGAAAAGSSQRGGRIILLTDGVFGHDGSVAPLAGYRRVLPRTAWMLVDDAHGAGVVGVGGRGAVEHTGAGRARIIQTMTLSKAFGVYGGVVLGPVDVIRAVTGGGWFGGSTPLPPAVAEAARRAVACLRRGAARRRRLAANVAWVRRALGREAGESCEEFPGPVVSVVPKDPRSAGSLRRALLRRGVFPSHIRYPGGPVGGYFRFAISSEHRRSELGALVEAVRSVGEV